MNDSHFSIPLKTQRIILRPFVLDDASNFSNLLKDKEVAATTLMLPYPCDLAKANEIIQRYIEDRKLKKSIRWAIVDCTSNDFMGGIRLVPNQLFNSAEIGFWLGKKFWGEGFTFEASKKIIEFGFVELKLNRIEAHSMVENIASIKLLKKLGFKQEGLHRELVMKWDEYKDVKTFGLLKKDYTQKRNK
ncbi:MAG: GNAT family N-acetyltransferase [Cyclobacteriaceae bacterium]|nr:GNAT family N-acetyltransferase [Cyclobacteriaceae bacterium]